MTSTIRLPAEWEKQTGVLISWPTASSDWQDNLSDAEATYIQLCSLIAQTGHIYICCYDSTTLQHVQQRLIEKEIPADCYSLFAIPYNDTWTRDYGPVSVSINNEITWLDFEFNAWGGKYDHRLDNTLTRSLHRLLSNKGTLRSINFVLEGGSIDSDGKGTVLTTSQCLLDPARNPGLSKEQIEHRLKTELAVKRILWLDHGHLEGDDTDAHVDTLARFCSPETITYVQCTDPDDIHFESLRSMEAQLKSFKQLDGRYYHLVPLPLPTACFNQHGQRLPATYANFLIINGNVLAPVYGVDSDSMALAQLKKCFSNYTIIPVMCRSLIEQFGSLHCITMQIL